MNADRNDAQNQGRRLRVVILGPYPEQEGKPRNGVESATSALADGLVGRGVEVYAVTCVAGIAKPVRYTSGAGVNVCQIPLFGKLGNLTGYAVDVRRIRAVLDEISPDIVHIHKVLLYARAALEQKWPSVITIHGIHHKVAAFAGGLSGMRGRFASRYEWEAVRKAKHVVCLNRYTAASYGDQLRAQDVRFIDNSVDDSLFDLSGDERPGRILFGGLIYNLKNVLGLLEAVEVVSKTRQEVLLRVAGRVGDEQYYQRCLDFVRDRGIEANVEFVGPLPAERMTQEISEAGIVVLPSRQETAPMIVSEAMAAGRAVIATDVGGTAEMVEDGITGLIVPVDDNAALASAIARVLDDDELRAAMGRAGRAVAQQRFRRTVVVDKTLSMYHELVGQHYSRGT